MIENTGLIVGIIALIPVFAMAQKEKWYVKRSTVQRNGITFIIVGLASMVSNPNLLIYKVPVGLILIGYGILVTSMINPKWALAQKLGNSRLVLFILILNVLIQYGILKF